MSGKSIFDKLWERHVVTGNEGEPQLMYVDQHYIHEVTSPQAFQETVPDSRFEMYITLTTAVCVL